MEKLNVRFDPETSKLINKLSDKHSETFSKVARDAITLGLGVMSSSAEYVDPANLTAINESDKS